MKKFILVFSLVFSFASSSAQNTYSDNKSIQTESNFEIESDFVSASKLCSLINVRIYELEEGTRFLRAQGVFINQDCNQLGLKKDITKYLPDNSTECGILHLEEQGIVKGFIMGSSTSAGLDYRCFTQIVNEHDLKIDVQYSIKILLSKYRLNRK